MDERDEPQRPTPKPPRPADPFAGTVINVKDFGATGNGTTDDTPALEVAFSAAVEGGALYFPPGTYLVSRPLRPKAAQLIFSLTDRATLKATISNRTATSRSPTTSARTMPTAASPWTRRRNRSPANPRISGLSVPGSQGTCAGTPPITTAFTSHMRATWC